MALTPSENSRYARHLSLPEVGSDGQERLKSAKVLVVGAGGLGCPAAQYLAAAGVGTLGITDPDSVDISNLQRQILYTEADLGKSKAETAVQRLAALNSSGKYIAYSFALNDSNALEIVKDYDLVLDATDNFTTRYLVNDACYFLGKTNVFASVSKFEGRLAVLCGKTRPCYRCLYPQPPEEAILNCAEEGILGVIPGILGTHQALLALKAILGLGEGDSSLHVLDLLSMKTHSIAITPNRECSLCGENPAIKRLQSIEANCSAVAKLSLDEVRKLIQSESVDLIDVREPSEFQLGTVLGARSVPLSQLISGKSLPQKSAKVVVLCQTGKRSQKAALSLLSRGYASVFCSSLK